MVSHHLEKATTTISSYWTWWWEATGKKHQLNQAVVTIIILTVLAIVWYLYSQASLKSRERTAPLPPGPRGLPIIGYLPFLGVDMQRSFAELAHTYGPIFKLWLGHKLCVVLTSPSLAKQVVRDQDLIFANRDPPVAALAYTYGGIDMAWSPYGSYWRNLRKVFVREMMSTSNLEACYPFRKFEVRKTVTDVFSKIGTPVDIGKLSFQTVVNVTLSSLWGNTPGVHNYPKLGAEFRDASSQIIELLGRPNISDFFPALAKFDIQGVERQMKRAFLLAEQIIDSIIDQKMKNSTAKEEGASDHGEKKDFLQFLLDLKEQEDTETSMTMTQIKALLMDILIGATDTSATAVEWVMAEMMQHPNIMRRAQEELTNVVGMDNIVEESHLPKLPYMEAVIKETLRLHPAIPLLVPKCPSQDSTVGGYKIPRGTRVFLNVWAIHRDPQFWDDPCKFNPERFLGTEGGSWDYMGNNFQYLPFGSGRRICAGIPLAERMVTYLLASLLHSFNWELPDGEEEVDLSEKFGIILKKKKPLVAIHSQRLPSSDLYL